MVEEHIPLSWTNLHRVLHLCLVDALTKQSTTDTACQLPLAGLSARFEESLLYCRKQLWSSSQSQVDQKDPPVCHHALTMLAHMPANAEINQGQSCRKCSHAERLVLGPIVAT
jgi:hypothetical protein